VTGDGGFPDSKEPEHMAVHHRPIDERVARDDAYVEDTQRTRTSDASNAALRALAAVAGGVATVIGIVALVRINWNDGLDSAPVDVAGMAFTPVVALATTVLGLIAIAAGVARDRSSKLAVGVVLACIGLGILIAGDSRADLDLETGHGWLALGVGAVLLLSGILLRHRWETRRSLRTRGIAR
jgi:hypothetical protein